MPVIRTQITAGVEHIYLGYDGLGAVLIHRGDSLTPLDNTVEGGAQKIFERINRVTLNTKRDIRENINKTDALLPLVNYLVSTLPDEDESKARFTKMLNGTNEGRGEMLLALEELDDFINAYTTLMAELGIRLEDDGGVTKKSDDRRSEINDLLSKLRGGA